MQSPLYPEAGGRPPEGDSTQHLPDGLPGATISPDEYLGDCTSAEGDPDDAFAVAGDSAPGTPNQVIVRPENEGQLNDVLEALGQLGVAYEVVQSDNPELGDFNPALVKPMNDVGTGKTHLAITKKALDDFIAENYPGEEQAGKRAYNLLFTSYDNAPYIETEHRFTVGHDMYGFAVKAVLAEQFEALLGELRRNLDRDGTTGVRNLGPSGIKFLEEKILPHLRVESTVQDTESG